MLKMKRMALLAVVALGLVALAAPAGASAKTSKQTKADIKRLGENVNELRKKTDELNNTVASLASVAGSSLTKLQSALTGLADTTANFKYGVIQVGTGQTSGVAGVGPTHFFVTPPLYKTGAQSTVTFGIPVLGQSGILGGALGNDIKLLAAVRSINPDTGKVACRVTATSASSSVPGWVTWVKNTSDGAFVKMPQSRIAPQNGDPNFPVGLVATEDNVIDLGDEQYSATLGSVAAFGKQLVAAPTQQRPSSSGGSLTVTFSCITT